MSEWGFVTGSRWQRFFFPWDEGCELSSCDPADFDMDGQVSIGGWFERDGEGGWRLVILDEEEQCDG